MNSMTSMSVDSTVMPTEKNVDAAEPWANGDIRPIKGNSDMESSSFTSALMDSDNHPNNNVVNYKLVLV